MGENLTIGFIGNPNCGKTTLFNAYTGANLKVANWPGVTVEKVEGAIKDHDMNIRLVDLPGTYSLTSYTMEEQVSRQFILSDEVDVIIDVADASALERNLYLTLQLLELGKPVVLALNMMDIVEKRGMEIDTHRLPEMLGIPVIPVSARKRTGLDVLLHAAAHHKDCKDPDCLIHHHKYKPKHRHDHHSEYAMVYSDAIEDKIDLIMAELKRKYPDLTNYRWHAIKLLEQDQEITKRYPVDLPDVLDRNYESDIINEKYDFIQEIINEVLVNKDRQDALTKKVDRVLTHRIWGIPIFLGIMAVVFFLTFTIGDWLKGYFEMGVEGLSELVGLVFCLQLFARPHIHRICNKVVVISAGVEVGGNKHLPVVPPKPPRRLHADAMAFLRRDLTGLKGLVGVVGHIAASFAEAPLHGSHLPCSGLRPAANSGDGVLLLPLIQGFSFVGSIQQHLLQVA